MYYIVKEDGIFKIALDTFWENDECIGVFKMSEWDNEKFCGGSAESGIRLMKFIFARWKVIRIF